jgi:enediyne biosynthesis protein E4
MNRRTFVLAMLALERAVRPARAQAVAAPRLPVFRDTTAQSRIGFHCNGSPTAQKYLIETMPGGVAMFDYDGDGFVDLYFVNGAKLDDPMPPGKAPDKSDPRFWNRLYRNNGDGTFTDVTGKAGVRGHGYGMGVAVGDYDNDGHADLYVTNFGQNILYHNNGDSTFTDVTGKAGVAGGGWSSSACFVDYDRDGWLDLIVTRYMEWDFAKNPWCGPREPGYRGYCHPESFKKATHLVFHNNGDGTFTDVSKECGIGAAPGYGLGIAFNDYDQDGWPDILIANDNVPEQLFHNLGNGKFEEVALREGLAYDEDGRTFSGMGADFNDYDNDGWADVVVGALANEKYALFRNRKGRFEYASGQTGLARISSMHSGWGLKLIDYDNDGWKDLFVAQGHVMDNISLSSPSLKYLEPMLLLHNRKGVFEDVSAQSGDALRVPRASRGAAFGDLDNDGFPDVAVSCLNGPAVILRNSGGNGNHWLLVNTVGTASNRDGIGARIRVVGESGFEQHGIVTTAGSYQSANDKRVHFGLGQDKRAKTVEILWPSGIEQKIEDVPADRILTVMEPQRSATKPGPVR